MGSANFQNAFVASMQRLREKGKEPGKFQELPCAGSVIQVSRYRSAQRNQFISTEITANWANLGFVYF